MYPNEPKTNEIIDNKYRILKMLGSGGMGSVYLVEHVQLGKIFAMKVLSAQLAVNAVIRSRFLYEAKLAAQFDHPHIIKVHDYNSTTYIYYVMDYIDGIDLKRLLLKGPLPQQEAVHHLRQIADAIDYLHNFPKHTVIHRDIKPANIMIDKSSRSAVIVDFGIAKKIAAQDDSADFTKTNEFVGTPEYMSPEQLKREQLTPSTDIYGFGLLAYEMLTAKKAFNYLNPAQIIHDISQLYPPPPSRYIQVPPETDRVFRTVLDKSPAKRYHSCAEFYHDLIRSLRLKGEPSTPHDVRRVKTVDYKLPLIITGASISLFILILVIVLMVTTSNKGSGWVLIDGKSSYYLSVDSKRPEKIVLPVVRQLPAGEHVLRFENQTMPNPLTTIIEIPRGDTVTCRIDMLMK